MAILEKQQWGPAATLRRSATLWLMTATAGHWIFLSYVVVVFGGTAIQGNFEAWNGRLTLGYVAGDLVGNITVAGHLLLAIIVLGIGPLQLIPKLRTRLPAAHRWLGRIYLASVAIVTILGLYMLFDRNIGSLSLKAGFVAQAALLVLFSFLALRYAIARDIDRHYRWALRFFMVASIALSYRIIFMIWVLITGGIGIDFESGEGAFLDFMAIGQFIPLLVLEAYFRTTQRGGGASQYAMAAVIGVAAVATVVGVLLLTLGLWFA